MVDLDKSDRQEFLSRWPTVRINPPEAGKAVLQDKVFGRAFKVSSVKTIVLSPQQEAICREFIDGETSAVLLEVPDFSIRTVDRIASAWQVIARNTPVLRSQIQKSEDDVYYQVVQPLPHHIRQKSARKNARDGAFIELVSEDNVTVVMLHFHLALIDKTSLALLRRAFFLIFNGYELKPNQSITAYNKHLSTKDVDLATNYWQKVFHEGGEWSPPYSFPRARQFPRNETAIVARNGLLDSMLEFMENFDVQPHDLLYAAMSIVADRHTNDGQRNSCFVIESRDVTLFKYESTIGLADQKFPLMLTVADNKSALAWISHVKAVRAEASSNAFIGYKQILDAGNIKQPPLRVSIDFVSHDHEVMTDDDDFPCKLMIPGQNPINAFQKLMRIPVVLNISVMTQLKLRLRHNSSVSADDAKALLEHFLAALENILENPHRKASDIQICAPIEIEFLLQSGKAAFRPRKGLVHNLVEQQARLTPESSAVQFESDEPLSYSKLNTIANQVARQIHQYKGSVIAVLMRTTPNLIFALFAILKAGAAYVILDTEAPAERNRLVVETVEASHVLVDGSTAGHFKNETRIENLIELSSQNDGTNLDFGQETSDTAYIIFTSGSTGTPKAALLDHNAAFNGLLAFEKFPGRRQLLFFNPAFSASQRNIWAPLCTGGCLCLASKENLTIHITKTIASMNINAIDMTCSAASLISPEATPSLRRLALGGEMLSPALVQLWSHRVELFSLYGLSECTQLNARRQLENPSQSRLIGPIYDTTTTYVLVPETTSLSPLLIPGELCLGGSQLAKEYLKDPELTKKRFIKNPFGPGKLFRTGDLALRHADGSIEMIGRIDFQVKVNGQKVNPAESNAFIQAHREVERSTVVSVLVHEKTALVAVIVSYTGSNWESLVDELRSTISSHLPLYMVPSFWVPAASLPLNLNKKVDMAALRKSVEAMAAHGQLLTPGPRGEANEDKLNHCEKLMRRLWSEFLLIPEADILIDDSFASLGGTSLEAVQIVSKLYSKHTISLRVEDIILGVSLAQVALLMGRETQPETRSNADIAPFALMNQHFQIEDHGLQSIDIEDMFPVTPFQEGVIANAIMGGLDFIYRRAYSFKGHTRSSLREALQILIQLQPLLRTTFAPDGPSYLHIVRKGADVPLEFVDKSLAVFLQQDPEVMAIGGLWWKASVLSEDVLVITTHHALFDYWSNAFIPQDISSILTGGAPMNRTPFNQYVQYVQQQDQKTMHEFWQSYLAGAVSSRLGSRMAPKNTVHARLNVDLRSTASKLRVTPSVLLYTAWAIVLAHACSNDDVVFGVTLFGRDTPVPGIMQMSGPALSIVPLRIVLDRKLSLESTAAQVQATLWKVARHGLYGMRSILKASRQSNNIFDTDVNFLFKIPEQRIAEGLSILPEASIERSETVKLELKNVSLNEINLSSTLHATISKGLVSSVVEILECFAVTPHQEVAKFLTPEKSKSQCDDNEKDFSSSGNETVSKDVNHRKASTPESSCASKSETESFFEVEETFESPGTSLAASITQESQQDLIKSLDSITPYELLHARIQGIAAISPSNIAVQEASGSIITYAGLLIKANQLAVLLRSKGVRAEQVVTVMLNKSIDAVVGMLGIMISGGAFMNLDGKNPRERNAGIIKDAGAKVSITDKANNKFFEGIDHEVVVIDDVRWQSIPIQRCLAPELTLDALAYVVYTSGSAGKPKGTLLLHRGLAVAIPEIVELTKVTNSSRYLWALNYVFDGSFQALFAVLSVGGTVCLAPQDVILENLADLINSMNVTEACLTPTMAKLLSPEDVPHLKVLCVGGEPVPPFIRDIWARAMTVYSMYGPTEATIGVSGIMVTPKHNLRNVGRVFKTVAAMILNQATMEPISGGEIGELCLAGPQIARGYLNLPEATAKVFCVQSDGTRVYHTGDLARWLPSGEIEFFGRKDGQVKLNGYRIELGEVESAIMQTNNFSQCVVLMATVLKKKQLVAFCLGSSPRAHEKSVLLPPEENFDWKTVVDKLTTLSSYMIPTVWFPVSKMPLSISGKINKKELLALAESMDDDLLKEYLGEADKVQISTGLEHILQSLWSSTLNVPLQEIHASSTFRGLGGDSISAINLASTARRHRYQITVMEILSNATLQDQAPFLRKSYPAETELVVQGVSAAYEPPADIYARLSAMSIFKDDVEDVYPCSPGQIEFMTQGKKNDQFWHLFAVRRLPAGFDFDRWVYLTTKLTSNNQTLRAIYFCLEENDPMTAIQVVLKHPVLDLKYRCYSSEEQRQQILDAEWASTFEVGKPCVRYMLLEHSASGNRDLVIKLDHASYDGSLLYIFDDQFVALNRNLPCPPQTPFKYFVNHVYKTPKQPQLNYWRRVLGSSRFEFLSSIAEPKVSSGVTGKISTEPCLEALAKMSGVTIPMVFQTAYTLLLAHLSRSRDVVYDNLISGRNVPIDKPHLINGTCANFLPFRSQISAGTTVKSILSKTQADFWESSDNGLVSLGEIYKALGRDRSEGAKCLFCFQPFEPSSGVEDPMRWIVMKMCETKMYFNYAIQLEIRKAATKGEYAIQLTFDERALSQNSAQDALDWYMNCLADMEKAIDAVL